MATADGSGWKFTRLTYVGELPVVITQFRNALTALALAGSGCPVLTMAY